MNRTLTEAGGPPSQDEPTQLGHVGLWVGGCSFCVAVVAAWGGQPVVGGSGPPSVIEWSHRIGLCQWSPVEQSLHLCWKRTSRVEEKWSPCESVESW